MTTINIFFFNSITRIESDFEGAMVIAILAPPSFPTKYIGSEFKKDIIRKSALVSSSITVKLFIHKTIKSNK